MAALEIRFSGSGGQGLILAARILAAALVEQGRNVAQSQSYEPVSRGGLSRSDLVVSDGEADYPLGGGLDYLLVLDAAAAHASDAMLDETSVVLADSELVPDPPQGAFRTRSLPFAETARRLGNRRVANIVALGALAGSGAICEAAALETCLRRMAPARYADLNVEAFRAGQQLVA